MTDRELLNQLARQRSENAFNEIVRRHVDLVNSAAFRQLGSADTARDITQIVFILLTKQAKQLKPDVILTGWLYRTTRNLCLEHIRKDQRRREREQAAADHLMNTTSADQWEHVAPQLEPAMDELNDAERHAVLLRYFKNKSLRDVGVELGIGEDAAQKRVSRALDRLRDIFTKRGVTLSATALATTLSGSAVQAAPAAVITTISTAALGAGLTAAVNTTSTMTTLFNLKTAAAVIAAAAITGTSTYLVKEREVDRVNTEQRTLNETHAKLAADQEQARTTIQLRDDQIAMLKKDLADLPRLRGEVDRLNRGLAAMNKLQAENEKLRAEADQLRDRLQAASVDSAAGTQAQKVAYESLKARSTNDLKMLALAVHIYTADHHGLVPSELDTAEIRKVLEGSRPPMSSDFDPWDYELVCLGDDALAQDGSRDPNTILVRQRVPMTDPNGNRVKIYALADGSVQTVKESTVGSFEQFERSWNLEHKPIFFSLPR